jgi:hypothetical protein
MPGCMKQRGIRNVPIARRVYNDHEANGHPTKHIEGKVALIVRHRFTKSLDVLKTTKIFRAATKR